MTNIQRRHSFDDFIDESTKKKAKDFVLHGVLTRRDESFYRMKSGQEIACDDAFKGWNTDRVSEFPKWT